MPVVRVLACYADVSGDEGDGVRKKGDSMSFCWHKWGMWEQRELKRGIRGYYEPVAQAYRSLIVQERRCERCGKYQTKTLYD